jgi:hypothetical protein
MEGENCSKNVILINKITSYICFFCLFILVFSCKKYTPTPLSTFYSDSSFTDSLLKKENLLVLSFSVDPILYTSNGEEFDIFPGFLNGFESAIAKKKDKDELTNEVILMTETVNRNLYKDFIPVFSEKFNIIEQGSYKNISFPIEDSLQIKKLINSVNAKYGIRVHSQFGAKWGNDNTSIEAYYFKVSTYIFDNEGKKIWNFCGKGYNLIVADLSLNAIIDGITAKLSLETFVNGYEDFSNYYPKLLLNLIEEDVLGIEHKSGFHSYFDTKDVKYLILCNCNKEKSLPQFRETIYD